MAMKRKKLPVWTVRWDGLMWQFADADGFVVSHPVKRFAVAAAVENARYDATPESPVSLRIFLKNGRIQEERTYGKGADPRRSKG